jgi:ABC-type multidrug transport system permease subunit
MILMLPEVPGVLLIGSLYFPVYYVVLSFVLNARRVRP